MTTQATDNWDTCNQRYLMAALGVVRATLERRALSDAPEGSERDSAARMALDEAAAVLPTPSALNTLCTSFGLSPFERDLLLLCAGVELDADFANLCANTQGQPYPTFGFALAALPDAHWNAIAPDAPLRYWRLLEVGNGPMLMTSPLRIDERILHYLAGVQYLDDRLAGLVEPLEVAGVLAASQWTLAERITAVWAQADGAALPFIQLCGDGRGDKRAIAAAACAVLDLDLYRLPAYNLPLDPAERSALVRLWTREAILSDSALLLDCDDLEAGDLLRGHTVAEFAAGVSAPLLVTSRERQHILEGRRLLVNFDVRRPVAAEQRALWQAGLEGTGAQLNGQIDMLVEQFDLNAAQIKAACAMFGSNIANEDSALWDACRVQARTRLDDLAQRIEPVATWDDLVLPRAQVQVLREIAAQVQQRTQVYERWGFAAKSKRGLGISALFAGMSGTGKTMAAEVLASELRLDLYRIDLAGVVSKYIGETEKNLRRIFDAAETSGALLLFDEADALFGKRSEVKDSHDRYANIEISYLLQRMEAYRGLAILTTNMKSALDNAFLRRIRFIVQFPFPDAAQRAAIWQRTFPTATPTNGLDISKLARLNVAGGNIRNIALNAAFLAADADTSVSMAHLLQAARSEYAKLEKPLVESEVRDWVGR